MESSRGNAMEYPMFHGLELFVLVIVKIDKKRTKLWILAGILMSLAVILFSLSIYAWVLGGPMSLVQITPLGGFSFILSWVLLAIHQFFTLGMRNLTINSF